MDEIKEKIQVDFSNKDLYISERMNLIENIKRDSLKLAEGYNRNITIEININPTVQSVKFSLKEFNL